MLHTAVLIALAAMASFPRTPADAARAFIANGDARITHVVQDGRLAVVTFRNAEIEGQRQNGQLLVKHFSFGWQPIDGASAAQADRLGWAGDLPREAHPQCGEDRADRGSSNDVVEIRAQMERTHSRNIIGPVRVSLLTRASQGWRIVTSGGGALSRSDLTKNYRVPAGDASALVPQDGP